MSLTITQANAVNTVLHWITGQGGGPYAPTEEQARAAAAELAEYAYRALGAGFTESRLLDAWPIPIGMCSLCPKRVPIGGFIEHLMQDHPAVIGDLPVVDVNDAPARAAVSDLRDRVEHLAVAEPTPFDWDAVKVGDLDPTNGPVVPLRPEPCCSATTVMLDAPEGWAWYCTRSAEHGGVHVSGNGMSVNAVWS